MKTIFLFATLFVVASSLTAQDTIRYDMLHTGERVAGNYNHYLDKNGDLYSIGDTLEIGRPVGDSRFFSHVSQRVGLESQLAEVSSAGAVVVIRAIRVAGGRRAGHAANFRTTGFSALDSFWINWENALDAGEVYGKGITRSQAIEQLTEAKQLLDLEIISQDEYDELREKLTPIIRGEN